MPQEIAVQLLIKSCFTSRSEKQPRSKTLQALAWFFFITQGHELNGLAQLPIECEVRSEQTSKRLVFSTNWEHVFKRLARPKDLIRRSSRNCCKQMLVVVTSFSERQRGG